MWDSYKDKGHIEAKTGFETYLFKDVSSKLVKTVWNESFEQPVELRYSYFSSQLKSFGIETGYCLILEKLSNPEKRFCKTLKNFELFSPLPRLFLNKFSESDGTEREYSLS